MASGKEGWSAAVEADTSGQPMEKVKGKAGNFLMVSFPKAVWVHRPFAMRLSAERGMSILVCTRIQRQLDIPMPAGMPHSRF